MPVRPSRISDNKSVIALVLIALFGVLSFSNTLHSPFTFDDNARIVESPLVSSLHNFISPHTVSETAPEEYPIFVKRYVGMLTFALNHHFNGLDVTGYHLVNIVIHILTAWLVYALVLLTFRTPFMARSQLSGYAHQAALLSAVLFVVHPVQTQAITYIIQRLTSLATFFYLASLTCYIQARLAGERRERLVLYGLSILSAVLGMKTKEIVFTLPLAALMYELFFFHGSKKQRLWYWLPLGLTLLIIPVTLFTLGRVETVPGEAFKVQDISRAHYLLTESRVLLTYLRLLVLPSGQNINYDYPIYTSLFDPAVLGSAVVHALLLAAGAWLYIRSRSGEPALRIVAMGIFWFYLSLSVESTLVPLFVIFEQRVYLPSAGLLIGGTAGACLLFVRLKALFTRRAFIAFFIMLAVVLATLAFARNAVWQSEARLWADSVKKAPNNIQSRLILGIAYYKQERPDDAMEQFQRALTCPQGPYGAKRFRKHLSYVHHNIGNILRDKDRLAEAAYHWEQALIYLPSNSKALTHLGNYYVINGNLPQAIEYLQAALRFDPINIEAMYNLAYCYETLGRLDEALQYYKQFIDIAPVEYIDTVRIVRQKLREWEAYR